MLRRLALLVVATLVLLTGRARADEAQPRCFLLRALSAFTAAPAPKTHHITAKLQLDPPKQPTRNLLPSDLKSFVASAAKVLVPHGPTRTIESVLSGRTHLEPAYFDGGGYGAIVAGLWL
jgi:hypothetical protein